MERPQLRRTDPTDTRSVSRVLRLALVLSVAFAAVLLSLLGGAAVAGAGELLAAPVLGLLNVPEEVFPLALLYLRIYLAGMPVILLYNFEAAIFRSVGETRVPPSWPWPPPAC